MTPRPMVNVYETDPETGEETLVYREMTDDEKAVYDADQARAAAEEAAALIATAATVDAARASIVGANLAAGDVTHDEIPAALERLLADAAKAIPFFEAIVGGSHPTDAQVEAAFTAYQGLSQAKRDRITFQALRAIAGLLRYSTGQLR